jgi:hypothetical protein
MRRIVLTFSMLTLAFAGAGSTRVWAAPPEVSVQLNAAGAQPRQLEDATQASILRDYKTAWQNLATAMLENRQDLIDASFAGFAKDKLTKAIADQKKDGLKRRYIDHGHKVEAVFYSNDGSAMQLKDTANVEVQLMDGDKVVASQPTTIFYVVLMTPAESSWKIRDLQGVPSF